MQSVTAVAVPARNEVDRIAGCISALDAQAGAQLDHIVVLVNNSSDGTADAARAVTVRRGTQLHVLERTLPPARANAGEARRLAMDAAARLAGPAGIVMTTDADGLVDSDWLAATRIALAAGADAVAGWVELHPEDWATIPLALHEDDARECAYDTLCDEIHARIDPDPADPIPRHTQHSGASLALTVAAYDRCGGVPRLACGEDRALVAALRQVDARVRHAPEVHAWVSGRIVGRSSGGMADTIRRRLDAPDPWLDERLEPAALCAARARCRSQARRLWLSPGVSTAGLAARLAMTPGAVRDALAARYFGEAWARLEHAAPALRRVAVPAAQVRTQIMAAQAILATLPNGRAGSADAATEMTE